MTYSSAHEIGNDIWPASGSLSAKDPDPNGCSVYSLRRNRFVKTGSAKTKFDYESEYEKSADRVMAREKFSPNQPLEPIYRFLAGARFSKELGVPS